MIGAILSTTHKIAARSRCDPDCVWTWHGPPMHLWWDYVICRTTAQRDIDWERNLQDQATNGFDNIKATTTANQLWNRGISKMR